MIVHVIDNIAPSSGGPTSVVLALARTQATMGHQVAIVCEHGDPDAIFQLQAGCATDVPCIKVGNVSRLRRSTELEAVLDRLNPDVLHLHCVWDPIIAQAALLAKNVPTVLSTHGMLHPWPLNQSRFRKSCYLRLLHSRFTHVRRYIALNTPEADHISLNLRFRAVALPNGVDVRQLTALRLKPADIGSGDEPRTLLNISRLHPIKGLDRLINAFAVYLRSGGHGRLIIAGPDAGAKASLHRQVESMDIADLVQFPGPVWGDNKLRLMAHSHAFAHSPRYEGFGIAVAEAIASGLPTVTTENCHIEGALAARAALFVEDSEAAFAAGIARVMDEEPLRRLMQHNGQSWASTLDWRRITKQTLQVYREVGLELVGDTSTKSGRSK